MLYLVSTAQLGQLSMYGALGGTRTHKTWLLRPVRMPIPSPGPVITGTVVIKI